MAYETYDDGEARLDPVLQRVRQLVAAAAKVLCAGDVAPEVVEVVVERHGGSVADMVCGLVLAAMSDLDDDGDEEDEDGDGDEPETVEGELS